MKLLNQIINTYTTPEQRKYLKQMGAHGKTIVFNNALLNTVTQNKDTIKRLIKQGYHGTALVNPLGQDQVDLLKKYLNADITGLTIDAALTGLGLLGLKGVKSNQAKQIFQTIQQAYKTGGLSKANQVVSKVRDSLVRLNPKAAETIKTTTESIKKGITDQQAAFDDFLKYAEGKGITPKTIEQFDNEIEVLADFFNKYNNGQKLLTTTKGELDDAFAAILKDNSTNAGKLFNDLGIKSKKEIPNGLKFIKEFAELLKNSPKRIKGEQTGSGVSGIDVYDIYQAFKQNGNKLIGLTKEQIKKNPILSLTYGSLGLLGAGGLAYVAGKKIFGKDNTLEDEIKQGVAFPGLEEKLGKSYLVGQSGKKYHIVGNKAYDYTTGKPANIEQFLDDVTSKVNFDRKIIEDQIIQMQEQARQIEQAEANGYQVNPQYKQQVLNELGQLNQDLNNLPTVNVNYKDPILNFDENGDIEEQYKQQIVAPQQQQFIAQQQLAQQQLDNNYNQVVQDVYNKIANTYAQDAENYFTPQNLAFEYQDYMNKVYMGQAQPMSPERFAEVSKAQYLHQLTPTLVQAAQSQLQALMTGQKDTVDAYLKGRDIEETARHNRVNEYNTQYKNVNDVVNEQVKRRQENISLMQQQQELERKQRQGQQNLNILQQNADTNRMNAQTRQGMLPYQQASYIGNFLSGAAMGDMNINDITGSNPELFGQIFPGPDQSQQQPTNQDKINIINNYYKGQK